MCWEILNKHILWLKCCVKWTDIIYNSYTLTCYSRSTSQYSTSSVYYSQSAFPLISVKSTTEIFHPADVRYCSFFEIDFQEQLTRDVFQCFPYSFTPDDMLCLGFPAEWSAPATHSAISLWWHHRHSQSSDGHTLLPVLSVDFGCILPLPGEFRTFTC